MNISHFFLSAVFTFGRKPERRLLRHPVFVFLSVLISYFNLQAQAFQKLYTNPTGTFFIAHDLCSDLSAGNFITGAIQGADPLTFVIHTNPEGQVIWSKTYTATDPNFYFATGNCIRKTADNGLIISAIKEQNSNETAGILLKTSLDGSLQWAKYASCLWRNSEVCTDAGNVYYAAQGKGVRKVFLGKISNAGQVLWEQWLEAGDIDFYTVESLVRCANGDLVVALMVSKIIGGLIGPVQTILFRLNPAGNVLQTAFFPVIHMAALTPLSDGRIAFRCSASDVTWTGMGIMDAQFNWQWFKTAGFGVTPMLPNIIGQELAVSADETRLSGIFYTTGGEKIVLTFDPNGSLLKEEVYFSGPYAQFAATAPGKGYLRASGITSDAFAMTGSNADGGAFDDCYFPLTCGIILGDTIRPPEPINWQSTPATCLQEEVAKSAELAVNVSDYCVNPGPVDAAFQISDTLICTGGTLNCTRNAGVSVPVFGVSEWIFEGGIPNISTGPTVENVHFNQPGTYSIRHIFMVAGCRDTAFATVKVSAPPMVSLGRDTMLCPADTLVLSAEPYPNATYRWSTGDTITSLTVANAGTYTVTVTQASTCSASDAVEIGFLDAAAVFLGADTLICPDATIRLAAPENATAYSLRWSTGATGAEIDISAPGLYVLEMDAGNCAFSDSIIVHSADCSECRVYAANVFAPESAGPGNLFRLSPGCPVLSGRWRMYDRWGGLLFETHDPTLGWDGRLHGKVLPPGVYIYDAELQLAPLQQPVEWRRVTGSVTLIR